MAVLGIPATFEQQQQQQTCSSWTDSASFLAQHLGTS